MADTIGQPEVTAMAVAAEEDSNEGIWQRYRPQYPVEIKKWGIE